MKRITFFIALVAMAQSVFGQTNDNGLEGKWSYGLTISGTSNYRILTSTDAEGFLKDEKKENEISRISFAAGALINYRISDRLSVNTGFYYSDLGYKTRIEQVTFSDNTVISGSDVFHYKYLSVPFDLKLAFYKHKTWNLYLAGGVSPSVFIGQQTTVNFNGIKNSDTEAVGSDRFNLVADLLAGINIRISSRLKLTGGLSYQQFLNATNSNLPTKEFLNSVGLSAGIIYTHIKRH